MVVFECGPPVIGPIISGVSSAQPCKQKRIATVHIAINRAAFRNRIATDLIDLRDVIQLRRKRDVGPGSR
jgi:hypothetical protein